jgi:adenylyltransferase/sulfurtransferase
LLIGDRGSLHRSLFQIDIWQNDWRKIKLSGPNDDCVCCVEKQFEFLDAESTEFSAVLCGRNAIQIAPAKPVDLDLDEFADKIKFVTSVNQNEYLVRFTINDNEVTVFRDGRAIIKGTDDVAAARSIYSRYIGT